MFSNTQCLLNTHIACWNQSSCTEFIVLLYFRHKISALNETITIRRNATNFGEDTVTQSSVSKLLGASVIYKPSNNVKNAVKYIYYTVELCIF